MIHFCSVTEQTHLRYTICSCRYIVCAAKNYRAEQMRRAFLLPNT